MVGLSSNPFRPSHFAAIYLISEGYDVIPVNPRETEVLGRTCYPSLTAIPGPVEVVDIFREPAAVPAIVEEAIAVGAKVIWMQLGVIHEEAAERAPRRRPRSGDGPLHEDRTRALLRRLKHHRDEHGGDLFPPPLSSAGPRPECRPVIANPPLLPALLPAILRPPPASIQ